MANKKKKTKYDPFNKLHAMSLDRNLEQSARELFELSAQGSKPLWDELKSGNIKEDSDLRARFFSSCHAGMRGAQKKIVEIIQSNEVLTDSQTVLYRGVADSMAWQMIGNQLCYARRFYKEHKPVNLKQSNFDSVVLAADQSDSKDPGSFSLISDLTTFVQVGDLLTMGSLGGLTIAEVKEGRKNHEIMEFMKFFAESGCPRSFQYFAQQHGDSGVKQLERMSRQMERMGHLTEVMTKGRSLDPDTNQKIYIPEETVYMPTWDEELNGVLDASDSKGWALDVVDDCLFIGSYSKDTMLGKGNGVFNLWFDESGGTAHCPRVRLLDCMTHPLAPPVFNWNISDEHKFDILFGRKNICIGLNISAFLKKLEEVGFKVRYASNKEASKLDQQGFPPYRHDGKAIYIGNDKQEMALMDGVLLRVLFHTQSPVGTIQAILNSESE
jgi:hypothetical protein